MSAMLVDEDRIGELYQRLVEVATRIMRSDFGSMQRYDDARGQLQLIAHQGLDDGAVAFWQWVHSGRATTCGKALETAARVVVDDFEDCPFIAGSEDLVAFRDAGVRSAQSTPLLTRSGRLVGMITTHWTRLCAAAAGAAPARHRRPASGRPDRTRPFVVQALRDQADMLLAADRYKDEFLATLAHELRNPLAPIRTGLAVLRADKPELTQRILPVMERQVAQMVHLIDDLLDVSRISRGTVTLRRARVELAHIVDAAVETSQPVIDAAGHHFTAFAPARGIWLDADAARVAQVISNFLNNAAKYTSTGGVIRLATTLGDGEVAVHVSDNGIGIAAEMLPRIFDLFTQVDGDSERAQGGLGVGLAMGRRFAEMHGGRIEVDSGGVGRGSVFTLWLPVTDAGTALA